MSTSDELAAEMDAALNGLEEFVRASVGDTADVHRTPLPGTIIQAVSVVPRNPRARRIEIIGEQFLVIQIGEHGGRWELGYTGADIAFAEQLIDAVIAGRITETFGVGLSRVVAVLSDGSSHSETALGALTLPVAWDAARHRLRGPRVHYQPYNTKPRLAD